MKAEASSIICVMDAPTIQHGMILGTAGVKGDWLVLSVATRVEDRAMEVELQLLDSSQKPIVRTIARNDSVGRRVYLDSLSR